MKKIHEPVLSYGIYSSFKFPKFSDLPIHEYEYMGGEDYVRGYSSDPYFYPDNFDKIKVNDILISINDEDLRNNYDEDEYSSDVSELYENGQEINFKLK